MKLNNYMAKPDKSLLEHTKEVKEQLQIINRMGYLPNKRIYFLIYYACHYHDYGKVNREFRKRIVCRSKFNPDTEIAHNVLSLYFIKREEFENDEDYQRVAYAVLTHHNYCNEYEVIDQQKDLIQELLLEFREEIRQINTRMLKRILGMKTDKDTVLIKGFLIRCDYSASAGLTVEYMNNFLIQKLEEMMERWKLERQTVSWNSLQQFCKEHTEENIIITAQTGMGKTEAGLWWMGNSKGFFVLPLRTAINAIYARIKDDIIENENLEERLALLHSDTLAYYVQNISLEEKITYDYYKSTKQLSMPLTVTTLDQIFDFVFQYHGYEIKLATLSYAKIVIDEIQMYGPDLLAYLIRGIEMIINYGGKVAVLTATLAPFIRDILEEKGNMKGAISGEFTDDKIRHNLKVYTEKISTQPIVERYQLNEQSGRSNKILVVCNTVNAAQKMYEELQKVIDGVDIHIIHSKFTKQDRSRKEEVILDFGKTYETDNIIHQARSIWVATSLVEASLDIDFDYLFTELSDLNALFQRLGRCNRKGVKDISEYNCFVFTEINKSTIRHGKMGFIDEKIYNLSKEALEEVKGFLSETEKLRLINTYFQTEKLKGSTYIKDFNRIYDEIKDVNPGELKNNSNFRNILSYTVIPGSVYREQMEVIVHNLNMLGQKDISWEQKIKAANEIKNYTLSIEPYVLESSKIIDELRIGKAEIIYVIDCYYDESGFRMKKNDGIQIL